MQQLKKELTLFDLTMIAIGSMIGSGIFLTPSLIAKAIPYPLLIIIVWLIGGLLALSGALTFAELGALMPEAGGVYIFLSEGYGKLAGFLYGWAYFLVVNTGGIAALSVAFATYLGYFAHFTPLQIKIIAVSGIFILTLINVLGVKVGGIFSDLFTLLKLLGIFGVILIGFLLGSSSITNFSFSILNHSLPTGIPGGIAIAMVGVLWSYGGWQHATYTAGEAKNPRRDVPVAMIIAAFVVTAIYVSINIAYMFLLPATSIASSSSVAADAVGTVLGPIGGGLIAIAIFISTFGTAGIYTLTAPRIYFAMANDGIFFKQVSYIHPRYNTPYFAIIFQSAWAVILVMFWGTFENLISYVVFTDWIFFALAAATVFIFRKRIPDAKRNYKTPGYPFTPLFFIGTAVWFVINTLINKPEQAVAGIILLGLGIPVYFYWKKRNK